MKVWRTNQIDQSVIIFIMFTYHTRVLRLDLPKKNFFSKTFSIIFYFFFQYLFIWSIPSKIVTFWKGRTGVFEFIHVINLFYIKQRNYRLLGNSFKWIFLNFVYGGGGNNREEKINTKSLKRKFCVLWFIAIPD